MGKYTVGQGCSGVVTASVSLSAAMLGRMIRDPARTQEMEGSAAASGVWRVCLAVHRVQPVAPVKG